MLSCCDGAAAPAAGAGQGHPIVEPDHATISGFQLSPAGKNDWGPNQTLNDKDKEVDHDERLRITGVEPGRYDAKVGYRGIEAMLCARHRDQGRRRVFDRRQGSEGLQQVTAAAVASAQPADHPAFRCLVVAVRIFAAPFHRVPFRMLAHPLRDIGRRGHGALLQRNAPGKDQMRLLAGGRREHGTDRDDQVYRDSCPISSGAVSMNR